MENLYKRAYDARMVHTANLRKILSDAVDMISSLVMLAASNGLQEVDSQILLNENRKIIEAMKKEQVRFERTMNDILLLREDK